MTQASFWQPGYRLVAPPVTGAPISGFAVTAMALAVLGLLSGWSALPYVLVVIAGHLGLRETTGHACAGRRLAITGLALGYGAMAGMLVNALCS
jgi:hypothetical protein